MIKSISPAAYTRIAESGASELRGEARTVAILDAALELIGEVGYERVTMDNIAARAHASKMTMYRRWPTKSELVADALRRHAQGETLAVPDTGTLRGDLLATVGEITDTLVGGRAPSLIGLIEAIHHVGREICSRATSRGEAVRAERAEIVLDLAFEHLFTTTLFGGAEPSAANQRLLVDNVLLPLLDATESSLS